MHRRRFRDRASDCRNGLALDPSRGRPFWRSLLEFKTSAGSHDTLLDPIFPPLVHCRRSPGPYMPLAIGDTGCGMEPATQAGLVAARAGFVLVAQLPRLIPAQPLPCIQPLRPAQSVFRAHFAQKV